MRRVFSGSAESSLAALDGLRRPKSPSREARSAFRAYERGSCGRSSRGGFRSRMRYSLQMPKTLSIDERIERAAQVVLRARCFYDIWIYYEGEQTRSTIIDTMQRFSEFFRFDTHANFVAFIVHMYALFEKRKDTINLPRLVKEMTDNKLLEAKDAEELGSFITGAANLTSKVAILRNNLFGHRTAKLSYAEVFKSAKVTANQLRELTDVALTIANRMLQARGHQTKFFNPLVTSQTEAMLRALEHDNSRAN